MSTNTIISSSNNAITSNGPMPEKKLRVLLADDHAIVREGLKTLVNAQPDMEVIAEAEDGQSAVRQVKELRPDVVVMDVSMPRLNGSAATQQIKQICPEVKVVALSMYEDRSYLRQLLEAGASGYVLKRSAAEDLRRAIRTVASGGVYLDPSLAGKIVDSFIRQQGAGSSSAASSSALRGQIEGGDLSEREEEVLRLIAQGYSNKEIAAQLSLSVKTVETYKSRSLEKLGISSRTEIIRYALQQGWLQEP